MQETCKRYIFPIFNRREGIARILCNKLKRGVPRGSVCLSFWWGIEVYSILRFSFAFGLHLSFRLKLKKTKRYELISNFKIGSSDIEVGQRIGQATFEHAKMLCRSCLRCDKTKILMLKTQENTSRALLLSSLLAYCYSILIYFLKNKLNNTGIKGSNYDSALHFFPQKLIAQCRHLRIERRRCSSFLSSKTNCRMHVSYYQTSWVLCSHPY